MTSSRSANKSANIAEFYIAAAMNDIDCQIYRIIRLICIKKFNHFSDNKISETKFKG